MNKKLSLKYDAVWLAINTVRYHKGLNVNCYLNPYYGDGIVPLKIEKLIKSLKKANRYGG